MGNVFFNEGTRDFSSVITSPGNATNMKSTATLKVDCMYHAIACWVILPIYILLQSCVVSFKPSCSGGFSNLASILLVALLVHYVYIENKGWVVVKSVLSPGEVIIMRQMGVFQCRRREFGLGFILVLDLYTDLVFPCLAHSCNMHYPSESWQRGWAKVVEFWAFALACVLVRISLDGGIGIFQMMQTQSPDDDDCSGASMTTSETFFSLAENADTALIPSVAMFCREMACEKGFSFDWGADTLTNMQISHDAMLGHVAQDAVIDGLDDEEVTERARSAELSYASAGLILKVLFGNVPMLWLQASCLGAAYSFMGVEARIKLVMSVLLSTTVLLTRCWVFSVRVGYLFVLVTVTPSLLLVIWAAVKICFEIFICKHHIWNLSTGCTDL